MLWFHILLAAAFGEDTKWKQWRAGITSAAITHALLSFAYYFAGLFVKAKIPKPPAASQDIRLRVRSNSVLHYFSWICCICCFPFLTKSRNPATCEQELSKRLWTVPKVSAKRKVSQQIFMAIVFTALLVALLAIFVAQFSWFPWPDQKDKPEDDRLMIGGKEPTKFFKEYVLCTSHANMPMGAQLELLLPLHTVIARATTMLRSLLCRATAYRYSFQGYRVRHIQ